MTKLLATLLMFLASGQFTVPGRNGATASSAALSPVAGMKLWYSADCITYISSVCGVPGTGTTLTTWADRSGNANTATVFSGTCTFNTNQLNSLPAVTFSSCGLNFTSAITASNGHTAFVVYETTATSNANNHFLSSVINGAYEYQLATTGSPSELSRAGITPALGTATNTVSSGVWTQINSFVTNQAGGFAVGFRMASATDTVSAASSADLTSNGPSGMGCYLPGGGCAAPLIGKIAEVIYYDTTLTLT